LNNKLLLIIKIFIAVILLIFLIDYINGKEIIKTLKKIDLFYFLFALILVAVNIFLLYKKWLIISAEVLKINDCKKILSSLLHGFAAGIITPFRAGEYLARNIALRVDPINVALATFFDKIFNMIVILMVGWFFLVLLLIKNGNLNIVFLVNIIFLFCIYLIILIVKNKKLKELANSLSIKYKLFGTFYLAIKKYKDYNFSFYLKVILYSTFHYFVILIQYTLILKAFGANNTFGESTWYSALVLFGKTIIPPISFGEVGIREASSIFFAGYFNIMNSISFNTSIIIFFINLLLPALFGSLYSVIEKK